MLPSATFSSGLGSLLGTAPLSSRVETAPLPRPSAALAAGVLPVLLVAQRRRAQARRRFRVVRSAQAPGPGINIFQAAQNAGGVGFGVGGGMPPGFGGGPKELTPEQKAAQEKVLKSVREFDMKPRDVKAHLDRYVIEQDDAKKVLSVAVCDHYNWTRRCLADKSLKTTNYSKPNILILGPTGSGKTYLVRTLAKMLGVPFVKADATKFSETGIVGEDAEDVVRGLVDAAGGDVELAQYGMVYIDEVDKITTGGGTGSGGWSGRQVQSNFLKIMEETEVSVKNSLRASLSDMFGGGGKEETVSTKFILFIFSGAFTALNKKLEDKIGKGSMGFVIGDEANAAASDKDRRSFLHLAETSDFVEAGLEPEFIGRVPVRVAIDALDADDLYRILTEAEDSVLKQYEKEFEGYGIRLAPETAALKLAAKMAVEEKTGARALVTVLEKSLRDFKFELPSTSCKELVVTEKLLKEPKAVLNSLLCSPEQAAADVQRWLGEVEQATKVRLELAEDVQSRIVDECGERQMSAEAVLNDRFRSTGALKGFKQIYDETNGNVTFFSVNMAFYEKPAEEIQKWLQSLRPAE